MDEWSTTIRDIRRPTKAVGLCARSVPAGSMKPMTSDSTGEAAGHRIQPPVAGPLLVQCDATAAPWQGPHGSPATRLSDRNATRRSTLLARVRRPRRRRPSPAEPEPRHPAAQPETVWDRSDDIVQHLFATGMAMRTTQRRCGDNPEVAGRIAEHMNDLQRIIEHIRSITPEPRTLPPQSRPN